MVPASAVGGAGLCVSAVAVHREISASERGRRSFCSAATANNNTPSAAASGRGRDGSDGSENPLGGEDIMVYQYKICPFCNKLKAVMDYLGIPYKVTEVILYLYKGATGYVTDAVHSE